MKISDYIDPFASDKKRFLIKAEHLMRYEFAKEYIQKYKKSNHPIIFDLGSATGYGICILRRESDNCLGFDKYKLFADCVETDFDINKMSDIMKNKGLRKADFVTCFETIEHLKDPQAFLNQIHSVLREEGILICSIPQRKYEPSFTAKNRSHLHAFSRSEVAGLLKKAGFRVTSIYGQPVSNIIVRYLKPISQFLNKVAFRSATSFLYLSYLFAYPMRYFSSYSYSSIMVCEKA